MLTIHIPANNRTLFIGQYVALIKRVKASPVGTQYKQTLCGWWPGTREEILAQFLSGVHERINQRGNILIRDARARSSRRALKCAWCGCPLKSARRFCDASCAQSFHS